MLTSEEIFERTEKLIELATRLRAKLIDAGCCQTRRDWDAYHAAEDAYEEEKETFRRDLGLK